ncbi:YbgC/FadM family acyl-CoA thioesterase [Rhodobacteraceae bacterium 2CG4]|uniref:YbgC/FadM family acyl-CoA thioesterase n=1 Tax=Halovulum marinum TaxID=2662447 RepID=A0A6L5YVN8_9RHOB|nr:YbgC/FadM family acyl-CoA thioesterase [Halovulum marinum]MSU88413.1 YbgC/FadM family acyl-CoA thioesterase [Halovulum marinum]
MHVSEYRIYYEDTDMAGIVYYANYLKYLERARSDLVREAGIDQLRMRAHGLVFAVARVEVTFRAPARFGELVQVRTRLGRIGGATLALPQQIRVGERSVVDALTRVICMTTEGRAARFPAEVRAALAAIDAD